MLQVLGGAELTCLLVYGVAEVLGKSPHYSQRVALHRASDSNVG